ncbi:hypothetical protein E2C01_003545 [Portunus trituberculatus]|uniref:Uncharacterized protein n=1 Tax=Portunus trituberculatus TaxID=210409 RepID=A0A5B7CQ19_PORTR|nr:hypothetical protein [Portunus trituberculatus]
MALSRVLNPRDIGISVVSIAWRDIGPVMVVFANTLPLALVTNVDASGWCLRCVMKLFTRTILGKHGWHSIHWHLVSSVKEHFRGAGATGGCNRAVIVSTPDNGAGKWRTSEGFRRNSNRPTAVLEDLSLPCVCLLDFKGQAAPKERQSAPPQHGERQTDPVRL